MIILRKDGVYHKEHSEAKEIRVEYLTSYLLDIVQISEDFTLADFFNSIENEKEFIDIIFGCHLGHHPVQLYIDDINKTPPLDGPFTKDKIEYINLVWEVDANIDDDEIHKIALEFIKTARDKMQFLDYLELNFKDIAKNKKRLVKNTSIDISIDVSGIPFVPNEYGLRNGIEFTPLALLKDSKILLDKRFKMYYDFQCGRNDIPLFECMREYTVHDVIGALLSELSFMGNPTYRDEEWDQIEKDKDEYCSIHSIGDGENNNNEKIS